MANQNFFTSTRDRFIGQRQRAAVSPRPVHGEPRRGLFAILWARSGLILAIVLLCLIAGFVYITITPPRYQASTAMLIDPRLGKTVGSDPVQPGFIVDSGAIDSQIKLLTSQTVLSRTAKLAGLADDPEFNGSDRSFLSRLLHPVLELDNGVDLMALEKSITVKRPERTYVVGIDVLASTADKAATIANDLTKAYIEDQVNARVDAARDDTKFVRQQLAGLSVEIKDAEAKVEAFKTTNNIVDLNGLRSNEQQVADLSKALGDARAKESDAKAKLDVIKHMQASGKLDGTAEAIKSLTIERLRTVQADTEQNVARLATTLGPRHPELKEAKGRQTKINKLIQDELRRLADAAGGDFQSAQDNETQILAEVDRLKTQSAELSGKVAPLQQLERNVKVLRASFDRFAQIRDNLTQQEADSPPGRVIAVARPPVSPARPKKTLVMLVALGAGLFFGLAAALFSEGTGEPQGPAETIVYEAPEAPPSRMSRPSARRYWGEDDA